ncbi:MAG TPA: fused MFS/spermidine synthase, partial [Candidatus Eisenbacteria bacterium]|nr:fused MFS/spermidine synthase [Candidatus Eisenbacteria bacterium]
MAGLILEIVWSKYLSYLLGNSIYGVSTVVAAFLGGLGIGAAWGGRLASRSKSPLAAYGRLEALVGLLALASPLVFLAAPPLFAMIYDLVGGYGPGFFALRFAFLFCVLLLPTTAMGATLPLLVEHLDRKEAGQNRRRPVRSGGAVARLYAINTAGAVTGVLLAGYFLIPAHGLAVSAVFAAAIDFAVATLVLLSRPAPFARPGVDLTTEVEAAGHGAPEDAGHDGRQAIAAPTLLDRFLLPMFALSGLTAILYQVAWTRILAIPFGGMVYAFSAILALYLLGLSLGAAGAARALRRSADPWSLFAALQIGLAAAVAFGTHYFGSIPHGQASVIAASQGSMTALLLGEARIAALVVMPPTLFLGALFPVAVAIHRRRVADAGAATGSVYAANTVGSIAGSILTAFVLIPAF